MFLLPPHLANLGNNISLEICGFNHEAEAETANTLQDLQHGE
jgi:hypothetical protein